MPTLYAAQLQPFQLAGAGCIIGDQSITFSKFQDISGANLSMASFGTIAYMTLEPGSTNEEQIQFTGITQNSNGTATITGVSNVAFITPYTVTAGVLKTHAGGVSAVVSNTSAFYSNFADVGDSETITGLWNFTTSPTVPTPTTANQAAPKSYIDGIAIAGSPNASTTVKGIGTVSVAPVSSTNPIFLGQNDPVLTTGSGLTTNSGTALNGTTNKIEDTSDTATVATANKVVRALGTGLIDSSFYVNPGVSTFVANSAITAGQAVYGTYYQSDGGIKFDNSASIQSSSANPSLSITIGNNSNRILLVYIVNAATVTAVTANGVAMTQIDTNTDSASYINYTYFLIAPATGSISIVVTSLATTTDIIAMSYYNASQITQPDAHSKTTSGSATTINTSTVANGATMVTFGYHLAGSGNATNVFTSGAVNNRVSIGQSSTILSAIAGDSGIIYPSAQSATVTQTVGGSGTTTNNMMQVSITPFTTPSLTQISVGLASSATQTVGQNRYATFIGFANASVSSGSNIAVTTGGIATNLSGLTPATNYYLSDTPGTISTTPGSNTRKVGIATSSTSILVTNIW